MQPASTKLRTIIVQCDNTLSLTASTTVNGWKLNKTYRYTGKRPYFFSSENYDFILHNDMPWEANERIIAFQIEQMNGAIPPQLYPKESKTSF